jgi:hypothetical protein
MKIELGLGSHCIQTSAKKTYERMLNRYLKGDIPDDEALTLEKQIEGIVFFLKYADFSNLRTVYVDLDGRRRHRVVLIIPKHLEKIRLRWDDIEIWPRWKPHLKD